MNDEEKIDNAYWVLPGRFLAGEHPLAYSQRAGMKRLNWLLRIGVNHFIDLTSEEEDPSREYAALLPAVSPDSRAKIFYERFPILDFGLPETGEMEAILKHLHGALQRGDRIYLHCAAGIGRTGLVVGCFLVSLGMQGEEALQRLQELRRGIPKGKYPSPETQAQRQMILRWKGCQNKYNAL